MNVSGSPIPEAADLRVGKNSLSRVGRSGGARSRNLSGKPLEDSGNAPDSGQRKPPPGRSAIVSGLSLRLAPPERSLRRRRRRRRRCLSPHSPSGPIQILDIPSGEPTLPASSVSRETARKREKIRRENTLSLSSSLSPSFSLFLSPFLDDQHSSFLTHTTSHLQRRRIIYGLFSLLLFFLLYKSSQWLASLPIYHHARKTDYVNHIISTLVAACCYHLPAMEYSTSRLAFIFLAIVCKAHITKSQYLSCNSNDLMALNGFRKCVASPVDGWGANPDSECCSWAGVMCDNSTATQRRVIGLDLHGRGLAGEICESLADLDQLSTLNLSHNNLHGYLPDKLFQMQNLEVLDLSGNKFVGSFPLHIHVPCIRILDVSDNNLVGSLTSTICDRSHSIESLNFSENRFHGEVPGNFGNCTSLQRLFLNGNSLSGSLPERLFQLEHLRELQFQDNGFSGPLHERIDNLSNVVKIDLSNNLFSGVLPDVFGGLRKLEHFAAKSNKFSGQLPPSLMSSPSLSTLNLNNNTLDGRISINCSSMARLTSLNLRSNLFQGALPENLSTCHRLNVLNLANNRLSGAIPSSFQNLRALTLLSLSKNEISDLSSALHILQRCRNLSVLALPESFRDEEMLGHADLLFPNLLVFLIGNSQLKGSIPVWLRGCENLQLLDLSWNQLSGSIPGWIGDFRFLFYLDLGNNSFTGDIPKSLSELPSCINSSRSFPPAGSPSSVPLLLGKGDGNYLTYNQFWNFPSTLDLSHNKLNGPIWPSFGNLKGLQAFFLENNQLSGNIPNSLSGMQSLEKVNLSHNGLTGEIPASFQKLTFLSAFDVSYNNLSGAVPLEGQFSTFPDSSFEGNIGLCGSRPSLRSCQSQAKPPSDELPNDEASTDGTPYSQMAFGIGAAVGFIWTVSLCFLSGWVLDKGQRGR